MRPLALLHSLYEVLTVIVCVALLVHAEDGGEVDVEGDLREGKQFGSGRPGSLIRNRAQLTRLEQESAEAPARATQTSTSWAWSWGNPHLSSSKYTERPRGFFQK